MATGCVLASGGRCSAPSWRRGGERGVVPGWCSVTPRGPRRGPRRCAGVLPGGAGAVTRACDARVGLLLVLVGDAGLALALEGVALTGAGDGELDLVLGRVQVGRGPHDVRLDRL